MTKRFCNKCGKEIEQYNTFHVDYNMGYESNEFDGMRLNLDLCGKCLDEAIGRLVAECEYNPVV